MIRYFLLLLCAFPYCLAAQDPCDPALIASISSSGTVCAGNPVTITFNLPDDDGDGYDVTYSFAGTSFTLTNIVNGHMVTHTPLATTTATLLQVVNNDDDDPDDECFTNFSQTISIAVSNPTISISNTTNPNCIANNGSITVIGGGGNTPYQYSLNGGLLQSSGTFTGLGAGAYTLLVSNSLGCTATTTATLSTPNPPTASISSTTPATCGLSNGTVTASATGGSTPYQYSINGTVFQGSPTFTGLAANTYTVTVRDANLCTSTAIATVSSTGAPTASISSTTPATCGLSNGTLTASATGGSTPYQYSINGTVFQGSPTFTGLAANTYTVTVRDANLCTSTAIATVGSTGGPTAVISSTTPATCGLSNGTVTASATGGSTPYQYSINGTVFQGSPTFTGLAANTYTVVVRDANLCTSTSVANVSSTGGPTAGASTTPATCGQSNGTVTASATGGSTPYQYSIDGNVFQGSPTFTGLSASTYTVTVRDANLCTSTFVANVSSTGGPTAGASTTPATCGQSNGTVTASATGGSTPYQYSIDGNVFQNTPTFTGLAANTYTVVVRDANLCTSTAIATVSSTGGPTAVISGTTPATCGLSNGTLTASATGGSMPYQYSIDGNVFQGSPTFTGLAANTYTVTVRDANLCTSTAIASVSSTGGPTAGILNPVQPGCGQANGAITTDATGGTPPYKYALNGGALQDSPIFGGLVAGTYTVVVTDAAGCTASATQSLVSANAPLLAISSQVDPDCGQNNGSIAVSASGGAPPYQFSIGGTTYQDSPIFGGLGPGVYQVFVRDNANCTSIANNVALNNPLANLPQANITANTTMGCISTDFVLTGNLPPGITGIWDCDEVTPTNPGNPVWSFNSSTSGNIQVTWTLSTPGCPNYDSETVSLNVLASPIANQDGVLLLQDGQDGELPVLMNDVLTTQPQVRITKQGTLGNASFGGNNILNYSPALNAAGNDTVVYEVCYTICENICDTAMAIFRNEDSDNPCFFEGDTSNLFTNGLTPNLDGRNDYLVFRIVSIEECQLNHDESDIIIYNRWGDVVFEAKPYNNNWSGKRKRRFDEEEVDLPPGVYYFVLRINSKSKGKTYSQFGSVILLR